MSIPDDPSLSPSADLTADQVAMLRKGEPGAAALLERTYRAPLVRFCKNYLLRTEDAEDAVQDVFCKILAADVLPQNFRAWLYRIARNHCLNLVRNHHRRKDLAPLPASDDMDADLTGQLTRLLQVELGAKVRAALRRLPESTQEALRLRYVDGLSRSEIAEVLDLKESVVKSRLFEGLKRIREQIGTGEPTRGV